MILRTASKDHDSLSQDKATCSVCTGRAGTPGGGSDWLLGVESWSLAPSLPPQSQQRSPRPRHPHLPQKQLLLFSCLQKGDLRLSGARGPVQGPWMVHGELMATHVGQNPVPSPAERLLGTRSPVCQGPAVGGHGCRRAWQQQRSDRAGHTESSFSPRGRREPGLSGSPGLCVDAGLCV